MRQPLGRGLDAILGGAPRKPESAPVPAASSAPQAAQGEQRGKPLLVPIESIVAGRGQPRRNFAEEQLEELAASIRENGILQPLVVVPRGSGYELIAGERRLRAAARAGLDVVPVVFRDISADAEMLELALIENVQREDLGPLERARAYQRLAEQYGLSQDDIARRIGKSRVAVSNTLRLLALPAPVLEALDQSLLTEGHARALLGLPTATQQIDAMQTVLRRGFSVRETEELVRQRMEAAKTPVKSRTPRKPAASPLESDLSRCLGTKVRLKGNDRKGHIEIEYYSQDELTRLIDVLTSRANG